MHSRLLERAAKLSDELGGGSITALPIIETQAGDVSAYIPTNVISITDGQIFLETELILLWTKTASKCRYFSISCRWKCTDQSNEESSRKDKMELAQYRELASFSQFGSDLDKDTRERLDHGLVLMEIIKQGQYSPVRVENQVMIIYAATNKYLADVPVDEIKAFEHEFYDFMETPTPRNWKRH